MNIKVVYHSESGSTKKVAEAIAAAVDVSAEPITEDMKIEERRYLIRRRIFKSFHTCQTDKTIAENT